MALTTVVTPALLRHFPHVPPRTWPGFALEGALNERYAFQVALRQNEDCSCRRTRRTPFG